jgi:hypothetical protein
MFGTGYCDVSVKGEETPRFDIFGKGKNIATSAFGHDRHVSAATCGWRQTAESTAEYKKLSIFLLRFYKRQSA